MPGVRISPEDPRCGLRLSTIMDSNGTYAFSGLITGTYLITAQDTPGYCSTNPNSFLVEIGFGQKIEINSGALLVIPGCFPAIAGQAFEDLNASGERNDGELLLSNVLVTLSSEDGSPLECSRMSSADTSSRTLPQAATP